MRIRFNEVLEIKDNSVITTRLFTLHARTFNAKEGEIISLVGEEFKIDSISYSYKIDNSNFKETNDYVLEGIDINVVRI